MDTPFVPMRWSRFRAMVIVSATAKRGRVGRQSFAGLEAGGKRFAGKGLPAYGCQVAETMTKARFRVGTKGVPTVNIRPTPTLKKSKK